MREPFKATDVIGFDDAESDEIPFLLDCFIDTGLLRILENCDDPRIILGGRTGAGKSALFKILAKEQKNVISIEPLQTLGYITGSKILRAFAAAGLRMDFFFELLWKHAIIVEIIKAVFNIKGPVGRDDLVSQIKQMLPHKQRYSQAMDFLIKWGQTFWGDINERAKEITANFERELDQALKTQGIEIQNISISRLDENRKEQLVELGLEVIDKIQVQELSEIESMLGDVVQKSGEKFYVTIDDLDVFWVEDIFRYKLIKALVETSARLSNIKNIKIIIALRHDLLDMVYHESIESGFQEEKLRARILDIFWDERRLASLLETRVQRVFTNTNNGGEKLSLSDILVARIGNQRTMEFMTERTLLRPRDIISFFNECIRYGVGKKKLTARIITQAEGEYSKRRLRALENEWLGVFPYLLHYSQLLVGMHEHFYFKDLDPDAFIDNLLKLVFAREDLFKDKNERALDLKVMRDKYEERIDTLDYIKEILVIFYRVGLVGLKTAKTLNVSWSTATGVSISKNEIGEDTTVYIHKAFRRTLATIEEFPESVQISRGRKKGTE